MTPKPSARLVILSVLLVLAVICGIVGVLTARSNRDGIATSVSTSNITTMAAAGPSLTSATFQATESRTRSSLQAASPATGRYANVIAPVGEVGLLVTNGQQPGATLVYLDGQSLRPANDEVTTLSVPPKTTYYLRGDYFPRPALTQSDNGGDGLFYFANKAGSAYHIFRSPALKPYCQPGGGDCQAFEQGAALAGRANLAGSFIPTSAYVVNAFSGMHGYLLDTASAMTYLDTADVQKPGGPAYVFALEAQRLDASGNAAGPRTVLALPKATSNGGDVLWIRGAYTHLEVPALQASHFVVAWTGMDQGDSAQIAEYDGQLVQRHVASFPPTLGMARDASMIYGVSQVGDGTFRLWSLDLSSWRSANLAQYAWAGGQDLVTSLVATPHFLYVVVEGGPKGSNDVFLHLHVIRKRDWKQVAETTVRWGGDFTGVDGISARGDDAFVLVGSNVTGGSIIRVSPTGQTAASSSVNTLTGSSDATTYTPSLFTTSSTTFLPPTAVTPHTRGPNFPPSDSQH